MRSCGNKTGPDPMTGVFTKRKLKLEGHRGRRPCDDGAEVAVTSCKPGDGSKGWQPPGPPAEPIPAWEPLCMQRTPAHAGGGHHIPSVPKTSDKSWKKQHPGPQFLILECICVGNMVVFFFVGFCFVFVVLKWCLSVLISARICLFTK